MQILTCNDDTFDRVEPAGQQSGHRGTPPGVHFEILCDNIYVGHLINSQNNTGVSLTNNVFAYSFSSPTYALMSKFSVNFGNLSSMRTLDSCKIFKLTTFPIMK
jgi:hypothetical protein